MTTATCIAHEILIRTVLVVDLVGSTAAGNDPDASRWIAGDIASARIDRELARFGGERVDVPGHPLAAAFDSPCSAIHCARAVAALVRPAGLTVCAGVHTGEVERSGGDLVGFPFYVGGRLARMARDGEVLVSDEIPAVAGGDGLDFSDRGEHALSGIPGRWRLHATSLADVRPATIGPRNGRATALRQVGGMRSPSRVPELEALRRIPGLESGPTTDLIALGSMSGRCQLTAGHVVLRPGRPPRHVLLIVSGAVELRIDGGAPVVMGPGELVGTTALRDGDRHREEAVVVTDAEVLAVRSDVADKLLQVPSVDRLLRRAPLSDGRVTR